MSDSRRMSRRGQRRGYDENNGYDAYDRSAGQRRMNGDYSSSALSSGSMTRELDDLVRTIESEWGNVTSVNVLTCCEYCGNDVVFTRGDRDAAPGSEFFGTGL